jgi:hypothetical protein
VLRGNTSRLAVGGKPEKITVTREEVRNWQRSSWSEKKRGAGIKD